MAEPKLYAGQASPNDVRLRDVSTTQVVASATIAFSALDGLAGAGAITCAAAMVVSSSETVSGAGAVTESGSIVFTSSETIKGTGAVTESSSIVLTDTATVKGAGAITDAAAMAITDSNTVKGAGAVSESSAIAFSDSATIKGSGRIVDSAAVHFTVSETVKGAGAISESAALIFSIVDPTNSGVTSGLVNYWNFDENSGTSAADLAGGNAGTFSGSHNTWTPGIINSAISFNDLSGIDGLSLSAATGGGSGPFTASAWINPTSDGYILEDDDGDSQNGYIFIYEGAGKMSVRIPCSTTDLFRATSSGILTQGVWTHVLFTWDGTLNASGIHIYINGIEPSYSSSINGSGSHGTATNDWFIGTAFYAGKIDDPRVWNRALSQSEITQTYLWRPGLTLTGTGSLSESASPAFNFSDTVKGSGSITDSSSASFTISESITGTGALTESAPITFAASEAIKGAGAVFDSAALAVADSNTIKGSGALSESSSLSFSASFIFGEIGSISVLSAITCSFTDGISGTGSILESSELQFDSSGVLIDVGAAPPTVVDIGPPITTKDVMRLMRKTPRRKSSRLPVEIPASHVFQTVGMALGASVESFSASNIGALGTVSAQCRVRFSSTSKLDGMAQWLSSARMETRGMFKSQGSSFASSELGICSGLNFTVFSPSLADPSPEELCALLVDA